MSNNSEYGKPSEPLVSLEELAAYVNVSPHTIRRWMSRRYLQPYINVGSIKRFRLDLAISEIQAIPSPVRSSAFKPKKKSQTEGNGEGAH